MVIILDDYKSKILLYEKIGYRFIRKSFVQLRHLCPQFDLIIICQSLGRYQIIIIANYLSNLI